MIDKLDEWLEQRYTTSYGILNSPSYHLGLKASDHEDATSNDGCNTKGGQLEQTQHPLHLIVLALHLKPILQQQQGSSGQAMSYIQNFVPDDYQQHGVLARRCMPFNRSSQISPSPTRACFPGCNRKFTYLGLGVIRGKESYLTVISEKPSVCRICMDGFGMVLPQGHAQPDPPDAL